MQILLGAGLAVIGLVIAAAMFLAGRRLTARAEAARNWTQVPARIESSEVKPHGKSGFEPRITYSYSVAGKTYSGKRVRMGAWSSDRAEAEAMASRFPAGSEATVRYDPHQHDFAVLLPEADAKTYTVGAVVLGLCFLIVGAVVAFTS